MVSVLPTVACACTLMSVVHDCTLNINVDFIRQFGSINYMHRNALAAGERALPRPHGESTRGKIRKGNNYFEGES